MLLYSLKSLFTLSICIICLGWTRSNLQNFLWPLNTLWQKTVATSSGSMVSPKNVPSDQGLLQRGFSFMSISAVWTRTRVLLLLASTHEHFAWEVQCAQSLSVSKKRERDLIVMPFLHYRGGSHSLPAETKCEAWRKDVQPRI